MDTVTVLDIAIKALVVVLALIGVVALIKAIRTLRRADRLLDHLNDRVPPLLEKLDVTVDAFDAELLRLDGIVTQVEQVSDSVSSTARAAGEFVTSPVGKTAEVVARTVRGLSRRTRIK